MLPVSRSCAKSFATDRSSNFLHATPIKHDPYTPDSMESPSPNAMAAVGFTPNLELESSEKSEPNHRILSPALLKSKLEEMIATQESMDSEQEIDIANDLRRNRSNSDVSWRKKKLSENDSDHGFHSYDNIFSKTNAIFELETREIPQIKIINASNMVSNESCFEHSRTMTKTLEESLDDKVDSRSQQTLNDILVSHINSFTINDIGYNDDESCKLRIKIDKSTQTEKAILIENGNDQSANVLPLVEQPMKTKRKRRRRIHDPNMTNEDSEKEVNSNTNQDSSKQARKLKSKKNCKRVNDKSRSSFVEKEPRRCCVIS